jgi:hypothetical protein
MSANSRLLIALYENGPDRFLSRSMPGGDVKEFLCGLWLVLTELVHQGSIVCSRLEH